MKEKYFFGKGIPFLAIGFVLFGNGIVDIQKIFQNPLDHAFDVIHTQVFGKVIGLRIGRIDRQIYDLQNRNQPNYSYQETFLYKTYHG